MKLYSISKFIFWSVIVLILLLPVGRHWRLLSMGERVEGTVTAFEAQSKINMIGETELFYASEVQFMAGDSLVHTLGPVDHEMKTGRVIPVYYLQADPSQNCLFNFTCLYLTSYSILPVILLIVWYAFYLTYNNYHRENRGKSHTPADSPYIPFRRGGRDQKEDSDEQRGISRKSGE